MYWPGIQDSYNCVAGVKAQRYQLSHMPSPVPLSDFHLIICLYMEQKEHTREHGEQRDKGNDTSRRNKFNNGGSFFNEEGIMCRGRECKRN